MAVHEIDRAQERVFLDQREAHLPAEQARQLVDGEEIGRIGHADERAARVVLQHERPVAASLRLRQQLHGARLERQVREIDIRNAEVIREAAVQLAFLYRTDVDQHPAELAAAVALRLQRLVQLLFGDQLLLEQQLTQPDALPGHTTVRAALSGPARPPSPRAAWRPGE